VIDAGYLWHGSHHDLDFPHLGILDNLTDGGEVLTDRVPDILDGFYFGFALRPTAGQAGNRYA
jgi:hypothetical protein